MRIKMDLQTQTNNQTMEVIDGHVYVNGVHVETHTLKNMYYLWTAILCAGFSAISYCVAVLV